MRHSDYIILIVFFFINLSFAQENNPITSENISEQNTFLHKQHLEKFSLHTNKSVYFSGENIWFKTYVAYDITETPNYKTSNLYINIYDSEKKLVANQLVFVNNGKVNGNIELPEDLKTGTYFIELETNWNTNFENTYIKSIQVKSLDDGFIDKTNNNNTLDNLTVFSFYPESNVILENTENTIYFTITKNNIPLKLNGKIVNTNGDVILEYKSGENGIGFFKLTASKGTKYFATVNDSKFEIPSAKESGLIIHKKKNAKNSDAINLSIATNKATLDKEKGNTFFVVIHRKGYVLSVIPIELNGDYNSFNLNLLKKDLFNGVNTITIFNQSNQPIAERNIYNDKKEIIKLEATKTIRKKDSTTIALMLKNVFTNTNVSISVLPTESLMYKNQNNILTDFLVTPYLKDKTGNVADYFSEGFNLDKLDSYIQTKSKTDFKNAPINKKEYKNSEIGMKVSGSIIINNVDINSSKVMLTSQENNIILVSKLKPNNTFVFDSLLLKQNSAYKLSLVDSKGKLLKAVIKIKEEFLSYKPASISTRNLENFYVDDFNNSIIKTEFNNKNETLEEVLIESKKKKIVLPDDYPDPKTRGSSFTKTYTIIESKYSTGQTAMDVIKDLPGILVDIQSTKVRSTRGAKSIIAGSRNDEVAIILNGVRVSDFDLLRTINATEIIEAKVNASGAGYGLDGFGGVVILKTKGEINPFKNKAKNNNTKFTVKKGNVDFGFTIPTENYKEYDLQFPTNNSKKYYSTLDWLPSTDLKPNSDNLITVFNNNLDEIKLIINGQNNEGHLIFDVITIDTKKNQ
ncbi:hypothetical protein [Lacinutrix sp. Bg11-31]|uniref:hypothetical protein n=1 Tax=Lacinutrix sp. Bg11-31 TaxID=2057808 RepID=UPI000C308A11|nr:hypothetical protein [Lacinutrix sp. Bg11-31]AUC81905.1 hypothetical protein CW733_07090 [Lacinutrix sp. Bg11-31]